jgi:hypothetical protein
MTNQFSLPDPVVTAFTYGDCGYLALELHALTGLPIVTASYDEDSQWSHVGVLAHDGRRVLDVTGYTPVQDWLDDWLSGYAGEDHYLAVREPRTIRAEVEENERVYTDVDPKRWASSILALAGIPRVR